MNTIKLPGLNGSNLFGFLASYGLLRLLHNASEKNEAFNPRLYYDENDFCAIIDGVPSDTFLKEILHSELQKLNKLLTSDFASIDKPSDISREFVNDTTKNGNIAVLNELAGLCCIIGGETFESSLCAANGAGHQKLVLSMRDVLALINEYPVCLKNAVFRPWSVAFSPSAEDRKKFNLGNRKPTLRLDPADEQLHSLRFDDPTSSDATYHTELGAQALAAAAFGGLPVIPRQPHPVTVGSEHQGAKIYFYWPVWGKPASYLTAQSLIVTSTRNLEDVRARGVFAVFRAARITGEKGKLSFAPTEPWG